MTDAIAFTPLDSDFAISSAETSLNETLATHTFPSAHSLGPAGPLITPLDPFFEDLQIDHPSQLVDYDYGAYTLIVGQAGDDTLIGGAGNDSLLGGDGDDTLSGQAGDDHLWGGEGNDQLDGGAGHDDLKGGSGDDVLIDADVGDRFTGGHGRDEFRLGKGYLPDSPKITIFPPVPDFTITDFTVGEDLLTLNFGLTFDDLTFLDTEQGVIINTQNRAGLVLLEDVNAQDLAADSFRFADPE